MTKPERDEKRQELTNTRRAHLSVGYERDNVRHTADMLSYAIASAPRRYRTRIADAMKKADALHALLQKLTGEIGAALPALEEIVANLGEEDADATA